MYNSYDYYHPTVKAEYNEKHGYWILLHGPETFYDDENRLRTWDTKDEAINWAKKNNFSVEQE